MNENNSNGGDGYNYYLKPGGQSVARYEDDTLRVTDDMKRKRLIKPYVWSQLKSLIEARTTYGHGQDTHARITVPGGGEYVIDCSTQSKFEESIDALPEVCFDGVLSKEAVFRAICEEREKQDQKWGAHKPQSLPGYLMVLEAELIEAKKGWIKNRPGKSAPLNEIVQLAAVAFACLEKYGVTGNTECSADDIRHPQDDTAQL